MRSPAKLASALFCRYIYVSVGMDCMEYGEQSNEEYGMSVFMARTELYWKVIGINTTSYRTDGNICC